MADPLDIGILSGFDTIFYSQLNTDGFAIGGNGTLVAGAIGGSPALRLDGAQTVDPSLPESEVVTAVGDDGAMVSEIFGSTDLPNSVLEVAATDLNAIAYALGGIVRTIGSTKYVQLGPSNVDRPDLMMILQQRSKSWASGYKGVVQRGGVIVPKCQIEPLGGAINQRQFTTMRYRIALNKADRHIWGESMITGIDGFSDATIIPFQSPHAKHLHSFMGDNSRQIFNLQYTPILPAAGGIAVYIDGIEQTYTTDYAVAGKVLTFVGTPATSAIVEAFYDFARSEL